MFGLDHRPAVYDVFPQSENPNFSGDGIAERSASSSHHESIDKDIQGMVIVTMNHGKAGELLLPATLHLTCPIRKRTYHIGFIHPGQGGSGKKDTGSVLRDVRFL